MVVLVLSQLVLVAGLFARPGLEALGHAHGRLPALLAYGRSRERVRTCCFRGDVEGHRGGHYNLRPCSDV